LILRLGNLVFFFLLLLLFPLNWAVCDDNISGGAVTAEPGVCCEFGAFSDSARQARNLFWASLMINHNVVKHSFVFSPPSLEMVPYNTMDMGHMANIPCRIAVFQHGVWRRHDSPAIAKQFYQFAKLYATTKNFREPKCF
jgi:hypothetical protein